MLTSMINKLSLKQIIKDSVEIHLILDKQNDK